MLAFSLIVRSVRQFRSLVGFVESNFVFCMGWLKTFVVVAGAVGTVVAVAVSMSGLLPDFLVAAACLLLL